MVNVRCNLLILISELCDLGDKICDHVIGSSKSIDEFRFGNLGIGNYPTIRLALSCNFSFQSFTSGVEMQKLEKVKISNISLRTITEAFSIVFTSDLRRYICLVTYSNLIITHVFFITKNLIASYKNVTLFGSTLNF